MNSPAKLDHRSFITYIAVNSKAESFLEIGVRDGDSTLAALKSGYLKNLILCDTWGGSHGGTNRGNHSHIEKKLLNYSGKVLYLDGYSKEQIPGKFDLHSIDMTHVDGDHSTSEALIDFQIVWPLTKIVMVVHDIFMPSVWIALSTVISERKREIRSIEVSCEDSGSMAIWRG